MKKFKMWNWWKIGACTLAGGVLIGAVSYYNFVYKAEAAQVGDLCPDFTLDYIFGGEDGKMVIDEEQTFWMDQQRGKVVVLNFWATYCEPCIKEIPHFNELQKEYGEDGLEVVLLEGDVSTSAQSVLDSFVNLNDDSEYAKKYRPYYEQWPTYDCTFGKYTDSNNIGQKFDIILNFPVTVVVDRNGIIQYMEAASLTYEELEDIVLPLL
ncbi:MAG: TlpA family protein disulfide reductase [Clostridiales bacterium]|nr:TlpA family protein disulfide reductase [Clostridiales bacterium]